MQTLIMNLRANLQGLASTDLDRDTRARRRRQLVWTFLSALLIVIVASVILGLGPSQIMAPWDVFILLDGAWRIFNGQVPHTDFHNPIGPLVYWLAAIGMHIGTPSLTGYLYGNVIFLLIIGSWGAYVFFRKLPPLFAILVTLFITTLVVAPRPLGYDPATTTYAMIYNRYGWALISILFTQLFVTDQTGSTRGASFDALSSGLLLGIIFFCKMNFFILAVVAVALAFLLRPELRDRVLLLATGFALVCLGSWFAAGVNALDYLRDVASAGKSQSFSHRIGWLVSSLKANFGQGLLIGGIWLYLIALPTMRCRMDWRDAMRITAITGFILGSALVITVGNATERSDIPLFLIAGVILLEGWRRQRSGSANYLLELPEYGLSTLIVVVIFFGGIFGKDLISLARPWLGQEHLRSGAPVPNGFEAAHLRDFVVSPASDWQTAYSRARDVPARINDGLSLLRRHLSPQSRLAVLALTDPFSLALGLQPPSGTPLWWDLGFNFDRVNHPLPEQVFFDASFVIYPIVRRGDEGCCQETVIVLQELYENYFERHYVEAERSPHWVLLKRVH